MEIHITSEEKEKIGNGIFNVAYELYNKGGQTTVYVDGEKLDRVGGLDVRIMTPEDF